MPFKILCEFNKIIILATNGDPMLKLATAITLVYLSFFTTFASATPVVTAHCSATFKDVEFKADIIRDDSGAAWNLMKFSVNAADRGRTSLPHNMFDLSFDITECDQNNSEAIHCLKQSSTWKREMILDFRSGNGKLTDYDARTDWLTKKVLLSNCMRTAN
jgi:hypothetical protein